MNESINQSRISGHINVMSNDAKSVRASLLGCSFTRCSIDRAVSRLEKFRQSVCVLVLSDVFDHGEVGNYSSEVG